MVFVTALDTEGLLAGTGVTPVEAGVAPPVTTAAAAMATPLAAAVAAPLAAAPPAGAFFSSYPSFSFSSSSLRLS